MDRTTRDAYAHCRRVTLKHAKTFYFASLFLPEPKRTACYAVYAFCRHVDDLVDRVFSSAGASEREAIERVMEKLRAELDGVYAGRTADGPVMTAWAHTLQTFNIERSLPDQLIQGVLSDLRPAVRFASFDQLRDYCYRVASVVGLMTTEIFGYSNPAALGHAIDLGIAMQLTNILRDINEDYLNGRIYLPLDELRNFGIDEQALAAQDVGPGFRAMMRFQIARAHEYYNSADRGIAMLEQDSRLTVTLMSHNYRRILGVIERNGYDVFSSRAAVPFHRKLMTVPALWYTTR
ncbi:MAG TPA: phytoene/squalene synthase family protein [Candidatus Kapabacteria bacterium]|nr:phytoene/squalene synthase family protein [Candidatus Kapabacteria bacterium]